MIFRKPFYLIHLFLTVLLAGHCTNLIRDNQEKKEKQSNSPTQSTDTTALSFSPIDSILQEAVSKELVPGVVLKICQNGVTLHEKALGYAQLYDYGKRKLDPPRQMTMEDRFDLASLTKVFATTFGVMILVDENKIDLDAPVYTYLPEFRSAAKDSITIRHLLTHSAGLAEWSPIYYHATNASEARKYIGTLPLVYPVGQGRHYSDLGFMMLGYIIQEVSGLALDLFLKNELYNPLGLKYTGFNPAPGGPPFAATSHGNPFEKKMVSDPNFGFKCNEDPKAFTGWRDYVLIGEVNDGNSYYAHGGMAGHAGLFSTASELQILMQLLLNKGRTKEGKRIIREEVINTFLSKDQFGHGLGWAMSPTAVPVDNLPAGAFGHTGFTGTFVLGIPSYKLSLILLTNRQNLDVNADGNYNSVTQLRKQVSEILIDLVKESN